MESRDSRQEASSATTNQQKRWMNAIPSEPTQYLDQPLERFGYKQCVHSRPKRAKRCIVAVADRSANVQNCGDCEWSTTPRPFPCPNGLPTVWNVCIVAVRETGRTHACCFSQRAVSRNMLFATSFLHYCCIQWNILTKKF